ncbi:hypothetical protein LJK87_32120 [Paenibacillus sp. P25]|nr:hypothetical protein LJK87_32120 [Paenibacillus sp. P25]
MPFTYETQASGIGDEGVHPFVWYQRKLEVPKEKAGQRVILHFQAVDYIARLWINGTYVGQHQGGYAAFSFDITPYLEFGASNTVVVKADDSQSCTRLEESSAGLITISSAFTFRRQGSGKASGWSTCHPRI